MGNKRVSQSSPVQKVRGLLDRFVSTNEISVQRLLTDVRGAFDTCSGVGFVFLMNDGSLVYQHAFVGVGPGGYNCYVYQVVDGLHRFGLIDVREVNAFLSWRERCEQTTRRKRELESLKADATALGYTLVRNS